MSKKQSQLFNDKGILIKTRHSFYDTRSLNDSVKSKSETYSAYDIISMKDFPSIIDSGCVNRNGLAVNEEGSEENYKNYEHDEVPVRDGSCYSSDLLESEVVTPDTKELTNSDLEKIEIRVFKNMSIELQNDESSTITHDHCLKLFKTTVQEILDKFYDNVHDFELYKKKFDDILSKNKESGMEEMEDFIKDMIQYIVSSESCTTSERNEMKLLSSCNILTNVTSPDESKTFRYGAGISQLSTQKTIEAYKNENYLTDSTFDEEAAKINQIEDKDKTYNIYLLNEKRCVEIKMDGRNLLSEINIRNQYPGQVDQIASADNVKSVAEKQFQISKYMKQVENQSKEKIIPVKNSYAKNNIHMAEFPDNLKENNKSFIYKICNFLCKKLRKTSFG